MKRFARSLVLAVSLLAVTAGATLAHECIVINRSSTGNQQAGTNSSAWVYIDLPMVAAFLSDPSDPNALPALTPSQLAYFAERAQELGAPADFAIFVGGRPQDGGFTIGDNVGFEKNGKGTDGSGIEHVFAGYFHLVVQAYMEALAQPA